MNNKSWIYLFLFTLAVHIAAGFWPMRLLEQVSKVFLLIILLNWFISETASLSSPLKKWVTAALCFSWLGDVLLLFQDRDPMFFLLGLSAFLIAHIFYVLFFNGIRKKEHIRFRLLLAIPVVIYYAVLIYVLFPRLGDMKVPVPVYGLVISIMLLLALHMPGLLQQRAGRYMATGAVLFIASDSILAFNKFYQPFEAANWLVMLTYGLAQLSITAGALLYLKSTAVHAEDT